MFCLLGLTHTVFSCIWIYIFEKTQIVSLILCGLLSQVSLHQSPALTGLSHAPHELTPDQLRRDFITCRLQVCFSIDDDANATK